MKQFLSHLLCLGLPVNQINGSPVRYYETVPEPPPLLWVRQMAHLFYIMEQFMSHFLCYESCELDKWLTCSILWNSSSWATSSVKNLASQTNGSPVLYYETVLEPPPRLRTGVSRTLSASRNSNWSRWIVTEGTWPRTEKNKNKIKNKVPHGIQWTQTPMRQRCSR